jgi:adenylate kinase
VWAYNPSAHRVPGPRSQVPFSNLEIMDIVLFGKPGVGKGTQAPKLGEALGVPTIATGDVLRQARREGTPMGREAQKYMDEGKLVPDSVILGIMKEALAGDGARKGAVLDGVVRTPPQAEGLVKVLKDLGRRVDAVLFFDAPDEEIVRRLSGRTVCEKCQTPYTGRQAGDTCTKPGCGGTLVRRADDDPAAIRTRLETFERETAPVLAWYRGHGTPVHTIDAVGAVDEVTRRALGALGR